MTRKTLLVTGATNGVGKITAERLANLDVDLIIHGRISDSVLDTVNKLKKVSGNHNIYGYAADFNDFAQIQLFIERVTNNHKQLSSVINSVSENYEFNSEFDGNYWKVNFLAGAIFNLGVLPLLKPAQGRLVNVTCNAQLPLTAVKPEAHGFTAYAQSRLAMVAFSMMLAEQVRDEGITVNVMAPGQFLDDTGRCTDRLNPDAAALYQQFLARSPQLHGVTGQYFLKMRVARAHEQAYDPKLQQQLWQIVEDELSKLR